MCCYCAVCLQAFVQTSMPWASVSILCRTILMHWGVEDGYIAFPSSSGAQKYVLVRVHQLLLCVPCSEAVYYPISAFLWQYSPTSDVIVTVKEAGGWNGAQVIAIPNLAPAADDE